MTAVDTQAPEKRGWLPGWVNPLHWRRRVRDGISGTREALADSQARLLSGEEVRFRFVQSTYWSVFVGLVFAQFVFGLYDGILQVHWYIHIPGVVDQNLFWLKPSWDKDCFGLVHSGNWPLYRHLAFRDVAGPAIATMGIVTLLAKPYKGKPVSTARLATSPLVVIALTFALGILGVYLAYFGLPDAWHHVFAAFGHPGFKVTRLSVLAKLSLNNFVIGFAISKILHRYWAPVGATLQGLGLDRSVDGWQGKISRAGMGLEDAIRYSNAGLHILPSWQRRPIAPPVLRERWASMWRANKNVSVGRGRAGVYIVVVAVFVLVAALGATGHYVAGHGVSVPYLFPGAGH